MKPIPVGVYPVSTDGYKGMKTSDPAWPLYVAFSGCGTVRCGQADQPLLHREFDLPPVAVPRVAEKVRRWTFIDSM